MGVLGKSLLGRSETEEGSVNRYLKSAQTEISNAATRIEAAGGDPKRRSFNPLPAISEGLRRTDYAATNLLKELLPGQQAGETPGFDPLAAIGRGLSGKEATTGKELVTSLGLSDKPLFNANIGPVRLSPSLAGIAGFITEAFNPLNPVNWLTFGTAGAVKGISKEAVEAGVKRGITAKLVNPLTGKKAAEGLIPGTPKAADVLAETVGKRVVQSEPYQKLAKSFSTKYVPEETPDRVIAKTLRGEPQEGLEGLLRTRETPTKTGDAVKEVYGKEAFADVRKAREAIEQMSRGEIDKMDTEIRELFKGLSQDQRRTVTDAVGLRDTKNLTNNLVPYYDSAVKSLEAYRKSLSNAGILEREMEKYVPFIFTGRRLGAEQKKILAETFGTGVRQFDSLDNVHEWYAKFIPNIRERTTRAATPSEVNDILGKKFFEDDIEKILSTYSARAIKVQNAKMFFDATVAKYGLRLDDAKALKKIPNGYGLFRVTTNEAGQFSFEPILKLSKDTSDVVALPEAFAGHINEYMSAFYDPTVQGTLWDYVDKANTIFKTMAYLWNPGHIPRDATSNMFQLWLMGMKNPARYADGIKVLRGESFVPKGITQDSKQIMQLARDYGLIGTEMIQADIGKSVLGNTWYSKAMGQATRAVDDTARLAGFIDQLSKGLDVGEAATQVKKYMFDYYELTPFERKWMKKFIPFYTWTRKNVPLQFQEMLRQPGKYAGVARVQDAISEPYAPEDAPEWIRESAGMLLPGVPGKRQFMLPNLPYADTAIKPKDVVAGVSPVFRTPFELAMGRQTFSGQPIVNKADYLIGQFLPAITRVLNIMDKDNPRQAARVLSTLGLPQTYGEEAAKASATYEERDRLRQVISGLKKQNRVVPTINELKPNTGTKKVNRYL